MRVWCHVELEERTLGTWEVKCHATLMHEHGSGRVRGVENTWISNGNVSNRFEGGVLHPKPILFDEKGGKKREKKERKKGRKRKERKIREKKEKIERKENKGKEGELCRTSISKKKWGSWSALQHLEVFSYHG